MFFTIESGLFLLGIALSIAGIVTTSITGRWSIVPVALLVLGIVLFVVALWLYGSKRQFWKRRATKSSMGAIAKTAIILGIVGAVNWWGVSHNLRWDLSENRLYSLSEQSQAVVAGLDKQLQVLVFNRNTDSELENLLQNYRRYSNKFKFRFINPEQEIGLAQQFNVQSLGEIYLQYGDKQERLDTGNLALGETLAEAKLTNAIAKIERDRSINVYLLQGHGEASLELVEGGLAQSIENLQDKGYGVLPLNLASEGKIPDNADLIIIAGANRKLIAAEVSSLQQYLQSGGSLMLLLSPNTDIGITSILQNWGIELDERLVVDGSGAGNVMNFGPAVAIVNKYGEHPITSSFRDGISLFPEARPLKTIERSDISSTALAITNQQTWAESDLSSEQIEFDPAKDIPGPLNIALALERAKPESSRMVVFGSLTFATNGWFEQQLNGDMLLNSVGWLVGEDREVLAIKPKDPANRRLNLSGFQTTLISWLALRLVPLMALLMGVFLWWRRR